MSGFRYQILNYWKRVAQLEPLPAFLRDFGELLPGDMPEDYVDSRYFSPLALYWEEQVLEHLAEGYQLEQRDGELLARIGRARRSGHAPTSAQVEQFNLAMRYREVQRRMPFAQVRKMQRRGIAYGPDYELDDGVKVSSAREAAFEELSAEWGCDVKPRYYREWGDAHEAIFGTR